MGFKKRPSRKTDTRTLYAAGAEDAYGQDVVVAVQPLLKRSWDIYTDGYGEDQLRPAFPVNADRYDLCVLGFKRAFGINLKPGETAEITVSIKRTPENDYKK